MKYLKLFEDLNRDEIKEYVESHLAYLMDNGFYIDDTTNKDYLKSVIIMKEGSGVQEFTWEEVKDPILNLLQVVREDFKISEIIKFTTSIYRVFNLKDTIHYHQIDDLLSDCYVPEYITSISIKFLE